MSESAAAEGAGAVDVEAEAFSRFLAPDAERRSVEMAVLGQVRRAYTPTKPQRFTDVHPIRAVSIHPVDRSPRRHAARACC